MKRKVVHRGYGKNERHLGYVCNGWLTVKIHKVPWWRRWLYKGKIWEYIGEEYNDKLNLVR